MKLEYIATKKDVNKTIKEILLSYFHISHRLLVTLKKENCIFLNNSPSFVYKTLQLGDKISVSFDYTEDNSNIVPKQMDLQIVYEDDWLLIVNKPAGIPVHPSILHYEDSLSNGIKFYFDSINLKKKIRPVTRIDKDTSGIVVFAKCEYIQEALIKQMEKNIFKKEYIAIVENIFSPIIKSPRRFHMTYTSSSTKALQKIYHSAVAKKNFVINAPIARKENSIIERCVDNNGLPSITEYEVISENIHKKYSVVKCFLKTGRTHQIRVHMAYINHPLLGDDIYGSNLDLIKRQALHCKKISFVHPITNKEMFFETNLPEDMLNLI